eukprot:TRINITY_DN1313_c0_g1_i1.p1 TRINITY_DN1313_c0_g1~~TRINITY_DN1313_c0_g1_i1.p1  ORF type:complete len:357 (+),score=66.26 TRINITY_DN1313_c0_g1_i1:59-1129(+)
MFKTAVRLSPKTPAEKPRWLFKNKKAAKTTADKKAPTKKAAVKRPTAAPVMRPEESEKPILHLVDANNWIYTSYYAMPHYIKNKDGMRTGAIMGFSRQLINLMGRLRSKDMVALAFDSGKTWRNDLCGEYKTGRKKPISLLPQIPVCHEAAVQLLGKQHCLSQKGMEADDIIAELASLKRRDYNVTIHTKDQDFLQLVSNRITVERRMKNAFTRYGPQEVRDEFGLEPHQLAEYWALTGQSADMIRGVDGVGPLRAKNLITAVGSLDAVWDPKFKTVVSKTCGIATKGVLTKQSRENAFLGKRLMQLPSPEKYDWSRPAPVDLSFGGPKKKKGAAFLSSCGFIAVGKAFAELCKNA